MAECFVATTEVVDGAAAPELEGLQIAGSEVGEAGAGLDKFEDDAKARIVQDVELSSVIAVSNGGTGTALGTPSASKENTDALAEQNFPCEDAQTHAALSGFLPESAGQVKGNLLGAGILSDGGGQLSKPKPCLLPDSIPVRPCRSSARVSEKERRELENAAREQSQAFELDSRESKERGRKDSKIAPKPCRGALTAPQDEHPDATECRLEKRAEEEEKKKQMVTAGALLGGERMDTGKQPPLGKEAVGAEKEKECAKAGSGDTAGEKTKKAAYWTHEEEEAFFSSLRQFGKNFEKIQAKVKSKDKEQVRHYYYRCIKRMNKLLQPGMVLDISNPLVVNTAMLRWWQVRADVKGDITDLHRKPRKHKQFQTAFEKAITADLHRKSKARKKQAANPVQPAAGAGAVPQAELPSGLLPGSDHPSVLGQPRPSTSGSGSAMPDATPSGKLDSNKAQLAPLSNDSVAHPGTGKKTETEAFASKTGAQQSKTKDSGRKAARAGGKARVAPAAGQALMGKKKKLPGKGNPKAKAPLEHKGDVAGRQQTAVGKKAVGPKPGTKRGRADVRDKPGKSESSAKRPKGRGKGAGEVINDVGSVSEASLAPSRGPGRPRKAAVESSGAEQASKAHSLDGLAAAAAHLERLEAGQDGFQAEKGRDPPGTGGLPAGGHAVRGQAAAGGEARAVQGLGGAAVGAAGKDEGQPAGKLTLQLFPFDAETEERVKKAGFVPFIELTLKSKKSLASIAQHLVSKWSLDQPSGARPALLAPSLTGCTVRLVPNIDRGEALSALSWGVADKSVAAAEVFALVGKPDIFRLKYRLLPPDCPLPAAAPAHSQGALFDQAGPQQPGAGSWPGHSGLPHSPLRPAGLSSPQYASAVSRGAWPPGSATEPQPHRSYRPVSPHHLPASPLRGHAAADDGSQRAFFWAADPSVETLGRAWEPPPPRYMPVSNSAPLGRGPGANDGAAFGDSLEQDMFGGRGGGEQAGMPTGGGGWLDNVEGVSISGFLNADGLRGAASSPFLDGHRSRSSLGLGSPPFSPQFWSPEPNSRAPFRAPADRAPLRQRSRLTAATALLGTILEDRNPPGDTDEREPLPHGALASSRSCSGLGAGPGGWGGAEDALPLKDLGSGESVAGLAPMLEGFGMALSTDGFDVQNWDKWASRSRFSASPGGAVVARPESCKRSPDKPRGSRSESREAVPCDESEGLERGAAREQSVDEADQLRVLEEPFEGGADERDLLKLRPDPDLYWGNSLGGFEDPRPPSLAYSAPSQDDFLLRAPAPLEIPFGDSLLLRSLESSNDGFLPATREVSKGLGRQGSARRPSSSGLGRSRSSGDLVSPAKGKRAAGTETGVEDTEAEPAGGKVRPSSPQPRPGSGMARGKGAESTAPGGQPPGEGVAQGPNAEGSRARRRSPSVGAGSQFQLSKAVLGEQPRSEGDAGGEATVPASKPFMALFPALPGQLTQEELLSAQEGGPETTTSAPPASQSASPSSFNGDAQAQAPEEQEQAGERAPKRKARAKPKSDGRSKLQKSQAQPGKRAAELSQADKAAAAALTSCFGKSPFARSSWQDAS